MRFLILGARGQVGQEFAKLLPPEQMLCLNRDDLDVRDSEQVFGQLERLDFDVVVNLTAFHNVDACEQDPHEAFAVNCEGAFHVAKAAAKLGKKLVFISTDYVFGGQPGRDCPYQEFDMPEPVNAYGVSKLAGEQLVKVACPNHVVIRTSSLYGSTTSKKGWTFPELMLKKARAGDRLEVVDDQVMAPTYTLDLVRCLIGLAESKACGIFHVTNRGSCSWFEFAQRTLEAAGVSAFIAPVESSKSPTNARRPSYSVLASKRLESTGVDPLPRWQDALSHYLAEIGELSAVASEVSS